MKNIKFSRHRNYGDFRADIIEGQLEDDRFFIEFDGEISIFKKGYNVIEVLDKKAKTDDEEEIERINAEIEVNTEEYLEGFID